MTFPDTDAVIAVVKSRSPLLMQIFMSVIYRLLFINSENVESHVASV